MCSARSSVKEVTKEQQAVVEQYREQQAVVDRYREQQDAKSKLTKGSKLA